MKFNKQLDEYKAHEYSRENKQELLKNNQKCGCFYCKTIFESKEIIEFIDWMDEESDKVGFALCPYCGIDSVIGEYAGYQINEVFMNKMYNLWFK
jgi:uncharacterized Zn-finger protein